MLNARTLLRLGVLTLLATGLAPAGEPTPRQPAPAPVVPAAVAESEPPLKDLTPPGFADLIPPDEHKAHDHAPGHLEPLVPHGRGFFVNADYLLMFPRVDGLLRVRPGPAT